jgi:hypothetical protein
MAMRHEQIQARDSYRVSSFPNADDPEAEATTVHFMSAPAMPDVPVGVGRLIVASYVAMVVAFAMGLGGGRDINFALAVVGLFVLVYFTVPRILLGVDPRRPPRPSLNRFLSEGLMTYTGQTGGVAALVQILIVPFCLVMAAVAMMVIVRMTG